MKCDDIIDAIGEIDIENIDDTPKTRRVKKTKPKSPAVTKILKWSTAAAAVIALFLIAALAVNVIGSYLSPSRMIACDALYEGRSGYGIVFSSGVGKLEIADMKITFDIPTLKYYDIPSLVTTDYKITNLTDRTVTEKVLLNLGCDNCYQPITPDDSKNSFDYADMYSFSADGVPLKEKIYIRNYNDEYYYGCLSQSWNVVMRQEYDISYDKCLADTLKYELISTDDYSFLSGPDDEKPYAPDTPVYVYTVKVINKSFGQSWQAYFSAVKVMFPEPDEKTNIRLLGKGEYVDSVRYKVTKDQENIDGKPYCSFISYRKEFKLYVVGGEYDIGDYLLEPTEYEGFNVDRNFYLSTKTVETISYNEYERLLHTDAENQAIDEAKKTREKLIEAYENDKSPVEYWYVYEITLEPGETVSARSTVPACGRMNYAYDPPIYCFDYYALDYSGFPLNSFAHDDFGPYEVTVNTDYYMFDTSGGIELIEKTGNSYSFTSKGGFDGEYIVDLCRFAVCESEELKPAQNTQSKRVSLKPETWFYIIFLSILTLIILVNVILIRKNKDKSIGT